MAKKTGLGPGALPGRRYTIIPKIVTPVTPSARKLVIAAESRTMILSAENRTAIITV